MLYRTNDQVQLRDYHATIDERETRHHVANSSSILYVFLYVAVVFADSLHVAAALVGLLFNSCL